MQEPTERRRRAESFSPRSVHGSILENTRRRRVTVGAQAGIVIPTAPDLGPVINNLAALYGSPTYVSPSAPPGWTPPQPDGNFDLSGLNLGVVGYNAPPLTPGQAYTWTCGFDAAASVSELAVFTTINGVAYLKRKKMKTIHVVNGDSIAFTFTLDLEG